MKRRIWIRRQDKIRQRYWKNFGSNPSKPVIIRGRKPNEFILVDSDKLAQHKKQLEEKKRIVIRGYPDNRSDLEVLEDVIERKRQVRQQSRKDIKFVPIEDLRTELETDSKVMQDIEDRFDMAKTQEERKKLNEEWQRADERFRAIKEKLYPKTFYKYNLTDEQEGF